MIRFKFMIPAFFALFSQTAFCDSVSPRPEIFAQVARTAEGLGYSGFDVTVCLSTNNRVVAGGLSSWSSRLRIFVVGPNGQVFSTQRSGWQSSENSETYTFQRRDGTPVVLSLGKGENNQNGVLRRNGAFTVGNAEIAMLVTCYTKLSGLE